MATDFTGDIDFSADLDPIETFTVVDEIVEATEHDQNSVIDLDVPVNDVHMSAGLNGEKEGQKEEESKDIKAEELYDPECIQDEEVIENEQSKDDISKPITAEETSGEVIDLDQNDSEVEEVPIEDEEFAPAHPYAYLVDTFEYQKEQLVVSPNEQPKPLAQTDFQFVANKAHFLTMLERLRAEKEIGVHVLTSKYSFKNSVALIQISTKDTDYLVDAIKLRHDMLMLTEIFINPKILKIMFRSRFVLGPFQNDLHLYMVNIFDVEKGRQALGDTNKQQIVSILKNEFQIDPVKKHYTGFDVRRRPLPEDFLAYSKVSTHYLIFLYNECKNKHLLTDKDAYMAFLDECRKLSKLSYSDNKTAPLTTMEEELKNIHNCELEILKNLYAWRRNTAKKLNLPPETVIKHSFLMRVTRSLTFDVDELNILAQSGYVKQEIDKVKNIIYDARTKFGIQGKFIIRFKSNNQQKKQQPLNKPNQGPLNKSPINKPQKRKINEQQPIINKQMKMDQGNEPKPPRKNPRRRPKGPMKSPFNPNLNQGQNFRPNAPKATNNNPRPRFKSNPPAGRFDRRQNDSFQSTSSDQTFKGSNSLSINPTNIPSSFTFQPRNSGGNSFREFTSNRNFNSSGNMMSNNSYSNSDERLFNSFLEFNKNRELMAQDDMDSRRFQSRTPIDDKIDLLERRLNDSQPRNRSGPGYSNSRYYNNSANRRRY